jgi:hypothetical protein
VPPTEINIGRSRHWASFDFAQEERTVTA